MNNLNFQTELQSRLEGIFPSVGISWLTQTTSTNDNVKALIRSGRDRQYYCMACDEQTQGRGTKERTWVTPRRAVMVSVGVPLDVDLSQYQGVTIAIGAAVAGALCSAGFPVTLKWPNDLWYKNGKVGGILCEIVKSSLGTRHMVVGVGINVAVDEGMASAGGYPVSALEESEKTPADIVALTACVVAAVTSCIKNFPGCDMKTVAQEWNRLDAFHGAQASIELADGTKKDATVCGINDAGALLWEDAEGMHSLTEGTMRPKLNTEAKGAV